MVANDQNESLVLTEDGGSTNETSSSEGQDLLGDRGNTNGGKCLDEILSSYKFGKFHYKMMLTTCGAYFALCSELLVFVFLSGPLKKEWQLDKYVFPILPLFGGIGSIVGEISCGTLSDRFGRKIPFLVSIYIIALFGGLSAIALSFIVMIAFRFCVFIGIGALAAVDFVLLLEFLPKKKRGTCMVAVTFSGALGALFASGMGWLFLPSGDWRYFVGACAAPAVLVGIYSPFLVEESPRYLFLSDREGDGLAVLWRIAEQNNLEIPQGKIHCPPNPKRGKYSDLFRKGNALKTILLGLIWFLQATGYWGVTVYLPEYMASQGIDPYFNMFTIFIGELPGFCLAMILIEPYMFGRIRCLQFFSLFTFVALIIFAFVKIDFLKAVFVVVCYFFMVPIYSILNTYTPEVYPTMFRASAMALVNMIIEIPGLVTPFVGEYLLGYNGDYEWLYPVVWAGTFFLQFVCCLGLRQETAGKSLQDHALKPVENESIL